MTHSILTKTTTTLSLFATLALQPACASDSSSTIDSGEALGTGGAGGGSKEGDSRLLTDALPARACTAERTSVAPPDGLISDFVATSGESNPVVGAIIAYPVKDPIAPTYDTSGASLHITMNRPTASEPQYLGVILAGEEHCIDASTFQGVQFSISGSFSGCTMQFYAGDDTHQDVSSGAPFATGPTGSYPPQATIRADQVKSGPQILRIPFTAQLGGSPSTPVDGSRLIAIGWQFTVEPTSSNAPSSCVVDVTIDDVRFFAEGALHRATDSDFLPRSPARRDRCLGSTVACGSSTCEKETQACCLDAYAGTETCIPADRFCGTPTSTGAPATCDQQSDCPRGQSCCLHSAAGYLSILCMPDAECPGDYPFVSNRVLCESPVERRTCPLGETCAPTLGAIPAGWSVCTP